ncbi:MAG: OmpA family protein [Rhizobiaceae bacterium]|nr:OmpA family protein [Rhizobiaceae bacterium]
MYNWKKWIWPGVLAVIVLTFLSVWFRADGIQADLTEKASNDLAREHSWASVKLDGRDLTLSGVAPSPQSSQSALEIARNAYDVRIVNDATELPPLVEPYKLSVNKSDGQIVLSGHAPGESTKAALLEAAKAAAPTKEIVDQLAIGRGAPKGFQQLGEFLISQFEFLENGELELADTSIELSGLAAGLDEYDAVTSVLSGDIQSDGVIAGLDITPPTISPYEWKADYDGSKVVVSGFAPNADAKSAIGETIKSQLPDAELSNELRIAAGAPAEFKTATDYAAGFLPRMSMGRTQYKDTEFSVSGVAKSSSDFQAAAARLTDFPSGYTLAENGLQPNGVSPFIWSVEKDGNSIILDGHAPSIKVRDLIVDRAKTEFSGLEIIDQIEIAGGAAETFSSATDLALSILPRLSKGSAKLVDNFLSISGQTDSLDDYNDALQAIAAGLQGVALSGDIIPPEASPYRWSLSKTTNGNVLRGNAANAEDAEAAVRLARSSIGEDVADKQTIASGQPDGFASARQAVAGFLGRLEAGQANIVDKTISITGRAPSESIAKLIDIQLRAKAPEGYTATSNILWPVVEVKEPEPPLADPYRWSVSKLPSGVTVLGNIADEADGVSVADLVERTLSATEFTNKQIIARGKPEGFDAARELVIKQVRFLEAGQGNIIGTKISVTGRAKNENIRNLIDRAITGNLPDEFTGSTNIVFPKTEAVIAKPVAVLPPVAKPYRWSVSKNASGVIIRGNIADEESRTKNVELAKSKLGVSEVVDKQVISRGEPEGFDAARELVVGQIRFLAAGQGNIVNNVLSVSGRAKNENVKNLIDRVLSKRLPEGYTASTNIVFPKTEIVKGVDVVFTESDSEPEPEPEPQPGSEPEITAEVCQEAIVSAVDGRKILFETARAIILPESEPVLKAVIEAGAKCPNLKIRIGGHTDARGRETYNQSLSEARAASVMEYLISNGVNSERLEAEGFGETRPIGDNTTVEGRAQNRRIEFNVLK